MIVINRTLTTICGKCGYETNTPHKSSFRYSKFKVDNFYFVRWPQQRQLLFLLHLLVKLRCVQSTNLFYSWLHMIWASQISGQDSKYFIVQLVMAALIVVLPKYVCHCLLININSNVKAIIMPKKIEQRQVLCFFANINEKFLPDNFDSKTNRPKFFQSNCKITTAKTKNIELLNRAVFYAFQGNDFKVKIIHFYGFSTEPLAINACDFR